LAGVLALVALLLAQPAGRASAQTDSGTRASVGDVLKLDVEGRADVTGSYPVDKDGALTLPLVGRINAAGRTMSEIGTDVARRMSLISSKITQVTVTMGQAAAKRNFVLGAVLLPGMYVFRDAPTVWDAIAEAGGPTDDADLSRVEILSEAQPKPTVVDVTAGSTGDISKLPRLRPGDTVRVPRGVGAAGGGPGDMVFVFGAVTTQGPQSLTNAPDLVTAFLRAIPTADADFKNVNIVRTRGDQIVRMNVRMSEYFDKGDASGNPRLEAGDTIHFQRVKAGFSPLRVVGAVASFVGLATSILVLTR
jgi:protein involved in polysaccharide export with SLBB domain